MSLLATEAPPVRWRAGTRLQEVTRPTPLPLLLAQPVRYGDLYAEVRYAGATGTHRVHTVFLDVR